MGNKTFYKPLFLGFSIFVLGLTACGIGDNGSNDNSNNADKINEFNYAMPKPIYYEGEKEYIIYSDDFFKHRSTYYDEHLATLSIQMAEYSMNPGGPGSLDNITWYQNQSNRLHTFFDLIGFTNFDVNDDYKARTGFDTIGIGAASRVIKEQDHEFTVIGCTVRSGGYFLEWENNVFLGDGTQSDMMHEGWYNAAVKVNNFIGDYIKKFNITGWIKVWLGGYSRGGAITNIAGGLLDNRIDKDGRDGVYEGVSLKHDDLLVYTFEAPQGANINSVTVKKPKDPLYNNIFNVVNPNDIVPKVGMSDWGFQRFGVDKFITTEFFDSEGFESNRNTVKKLLALKCGDAWNCDKLQPYNIDEETLFGDLINLPSLVVEIIDTINETSSGELPDFIYKDDKKANYDSNIVTSTVLEQAVASIHDDAQKENKSDRVYYGDHVQGALRKVMLDMFDDVADSNLPTDTSTAIKILIQFVVYCAFGDTDMIIDLKETFGWSEDEEESVYAIVEDIFDEYPGELITLGLNVANIGQNHDTVVSVAHVQAQDSFWIAFYEELKNENISKVPLRSNAEYFCVSNVDINDMIVINDSLNARHVINMSGASVGKSEIEQCDKGYAVGYYHYGTYERSKAFMPACYDYYVGMYSHSADLWHLVSSYVWHYTSNNISVVYRSATIVVDEYFNCDSDVIQTHVYKTVEPEDGRLTDLTNTTWLFSHPYISMIGSRSINFESNGETFNSISVIRTIAVYTVVEIHYGDKVVSSGSSPAFKQSWKNENYKTIKITGGKDAKSLDLIIWLYANATLMS